MSTERYIELGKECGLNGKKLLEFVKDQQEIERRKLDEERQERQRERDSKGPITWAELSRLTELARLGETSCKLRLHEPS